MAPSPIPETRLKQIATDACESVLSSAESYAHSSTESWNTSIINEVLQSLISETTPHGALQPPFKYIVNSTIIQQERSTPDSSTRTGKRGMHTAAGAYWNGEKDGMWSFKYEGAEAKGMDVVVSVMWIAV